MCLPWSTGESRSKRLARLWMIRVSLLRSHLPRLRTIWNGMLKNRKVLNGFRAVGRITKKQLTLSSLYVIKTGKSRTRARFLIWQAFRSSKHLRKQEINLCQFKKIAMSTHQWRSMRCCNNNWLNFKSSKRRGWLHRSKSSAELPKVTGKTFQSTPLKLFKLKSLRPPTTTSKWTKTERLQVRH